MDLRAQIHLAKAQELLSTKFYKYLIHSKVKLVELFFPQLKALLLGRRWL